MATPDWNWRQLHLARPVEASQVAGLLEHLASDASLGPLVFEVRATDGQVTYFLGASSRASARIAKVVTDTLAGTRLTTKRASRPALDTALTVRPSRPDLTLEVGSPENVIVPLLTALATAEQGEMLVLQVVLDARRAPTFGEPSSAPEYPNLLAALWGTPRPTSGREAPLRRAKRATHGFKARIRVGARTAAKGRTEALLRGTLGALRILESPGAHLLARRENPTRVAEASLRGSAVTLSTRELVGFLGWPLGGDELPGLPPLHPKQTGAPKKLAHARHPFAVTTGPGKEVQFGLGREDSRQHTLLIGPTGSGKSNVMAHLALDAIEDGRGVLVIDPKGDLVDAEILPRIPAGRLDDVVIIDPTSERPVGVNPFVGGGRHPELVADSILQVFRTLYEDSWGPRLEDVLHSALLTLAKTPGSTLPMLPALLTDPAVRRRLTVNLHDPVGLEPFWRSYEAMSPEHQAQVIAPVLNKLRPYLLRTSLRRTLGQAQPAFDLSQLFTERRIVLVKLNKGLLGEGGRLLGALIVSQLWPLVQARAAVRPERRHTVNVVIDEVQDYLTLPGDLGDAFAQARGLGVGLIVGHQFRRQLPPKLLAGLDANARSVIAFGLDAADASELAKRATNISTEDFMTLPKHHAYARLMVDGESTGWFSARTLGPTETTADAAALARRSAERWGRDAAEIDREIERAVELGSEAEPTPPPAVGRRKREVTP